MSHTSRLDSNCHRSVKSYSEISRVSVDAYNKVWEDIIKRKGLEKKADIENQKILEMQASAEKERMQRVKQLHEKNQGEVLRQIEETHKRKIVEKVVDQMKYNEVVQNMPEDLVNVYPRITETPIAIRRARKEKVQSEVKKNLLDQIGQQVEAKKTQKRISMGSELEQIKKEQYMKELEELDKIAAQKAIMKTYQNELVREMQLKNILKMAEKAQDEREIQRLMQAKEMLSPTLETEISPSKISDSIRKFSLEGNNLGGKRIQKDYLNLEQPESPEPDKNENEAEEKRDEEPKIEENKDDQPQDEKNNENDVKNEENDQPKEENETKNKEKAKRDSEKESAYKKRLQEKEKLRQQQKQMRIKLLQDQMLRKQQLERQQLTISTIPAKSTSSSPLKYRNLAAMISSPVKPDNRIYQHNAAMILNSKHEAATNIRPQNSKNSCSIRMPVESYSNNVKENHSVVSAAKLSSMMQNANLASLNSNPDTKRAMNGPQFLHGGNSHNFFVTTEH